jgi:hypothetical protein
MEILLVLGGLVLLALLAYRFGADSRRPDDRGWLGAAGGDDAAA